MNLRYKRFACGTLLIAGLAVLSAQEKGRNAANSPVWIGTWAASQQIPEPQNALPREALHDVTIRQIVRASLAGAMLRVRLSNAFGTEPLTFTSVHIGRPRSAASAEIVPGSDAALTFSGAPDVTVPAGAEYFSDPIAYPLAALSNLAITFHLDTAPAQQTGHPGSRATSYYLHGNFVSALDLPDAQRVDHWYQIAGVEVEAFPDGACIVALGDSITDGHAATTNGNDRWTDVLAQRLQASAATQDIGVLNEGIGGNHLLTDGLGPNALARFDRDVLAQPGVRWVIILEGINDLGKLAQAGEASAAEHELLRHQIIGAYEQMIARAHTHGIKVIGGTLTPFAESHYYHPDETSEADREEINRWIRTAGHFDAVIDFDQILRDPQRPDRFLPTYDSGDHLHPSPAGYRAMGEAIPLSLFRAVPELTSAF